MPTNNRVFYATQLIHLNPQNTDGTAVSSQNYTPRSVQSVGITTNFNLTEVFSAFSRSFNNFDIYSVQFMLALHFSHIYSIFHQISVFYTGCSL